VKEIRLAIMEYMKLLGYEFDEDLGDYGIMRPNKEPNAITEKDKAIINVFQTIYEKLEEEFNVYKD
jgi:hypothetical protein